MMLFYIRKAVLAIFCLAITSSAIAQIETLALQDFDGGTPGWNYSSNVPFFDNGWGSDGYFGTIDISNASPLDNPNFSGIILGENDLDDEGDNGTSGFADITFEDVNINGSQDVTLSFDYQIDGYNVGGDDAKYQVFHDGIGQGEEFLVEGGVDPEDAQGSVSIPVPDGVNSVSLVVSIRNNGGDGFSGFDNFKVEGTEPNSIVSASNNFYTASESNNNYAIPLNVIAPDDVNDIDVTISYVSGNTDLIDNFSSTTVTIPAGATSGTFNLPRAEDGICTGTQEVVLEITAVSGGNNAQIGTPASFTVSFTDDQTTYSTAASDNFESGTFDGWLNTNLWVIDSTDPTTGNNSAQHTESDGGAGHKYIAKSLGSLDLNSGKTVWQANIDYNIADPSSQNWFYYALTASSSNMYTANQGYAVGINFDSGVDDLVLVKYENGIHSAISGYTNPVEVASTSYTWNSAGILGIRVERDDAGNWEVFVQDGGGFNNMISVGTGSDNEYNDAAYMAFGTDVSSSNYGAFQFDNVLVTQESCSGDYYTVTSGNSDEAIWSTDENAGPGDGFVLTYTSNNRLTVQDGHTLTLSGEVKALDFSIDPAGTVVLNGNELSVYEDLVAAGNVDGTTGTLSFKGNGEQNILVGGTPLRVQNLKIQNNGPKVEIQSGEVEVTGLLMPVAGTLVTGSNPARLVLISNASGTAAVDVFNPAAEIDGNVRAQRYLPASEDGWVNLSGMLENVTVQQWDDNIITTGYPDSDYPDYEFFNIRGYDETIDAGINGRFQNITTNSTNLPVSSGYFVYLLGGSQTVEVEGEIARGNIVKPVSFSGYSGPLEDGWNLVANPYPSAIDFDALYDASSGIKPTMYIYSAQQSSYVTYNTDNPGAGTGSNIIPAGQAFFVKLDGGSGQLNFNENQKVGPHADFQRTNEGAKPTLQLRIEGDGEAADYTHVTLDDAATFNYDFVDALHLGSMNEEAPGISTISQEEYKLSLNSVPTNEGAIAIPVNVNIPVAGTYTLEVSDLINFPSSSCLSIEDLESGEVTPIELGQSFEIVADEAINEVRFMIHITSLNSAKTDVSCFNGSDGSVAARGAGAGPWTYTWYNEMGEVIAQEENITITSEVEDLAFGTYYVEVEDENSVCGTLTKVIEINEPMPEELSLSSQPATCNNEDGELVIDVENSSAIDYSVLGDNGTELSGSVDGTSLTIPMLQGDVYTVNISTACNTFEQMTVDLTDENAVTAAIEIENDVVEMQNGIAEVQFSHNSENATSVLWDFGNGETSEMNNPIHTFTEVGEYEITLTAQNEVCDNTDTRTITVEEFVSVEDDFDPSEEIMMTALRERVKLEFGNARLEQPIVEIYNTAGQLVISKKLSNVNGDIILIETAGLRQGIYSLTILENDSRVFSEQFVR